MKVVQSTFFNDQWQPALADCALNDAQLVMAFGAAEALQSPVHQASIQAQFPHAQVVGCSTAGEIIGTYVQDDSLVVNAFQFADTPIATVAVTLSADKTCKQSGAELAAQLNPDGLRYVLLLSAGLQVNGTDLVAGVTAELPDSVLVTGGLAGDGDRFSHTLTMLNGECSAQMAVAVGFYGDKLEVGHGCLGGWDPFGPDRRITRAEGNVLYELDGQSALSLYKTYLGEYAEGLPANGLLFPLSIKTETGSEEVVRTILAVDEAKQSMTFAGDMPEGAMARLMRANFDRLVDGAYGAAEQAHGRVGDCDFALLISCVGRKMVLQQRIEEEVEAVREVIGERALIGGFYSYGEISPEIETPVCRLHNQTMTITTFQER